MADIEGERAAGRFEFRATLRSFIEFLGVTGLIAAQPLFDVLARNASLMVLWSVTPIELFAFVVIVVLVPPIVVVVAESLIAAVVPRARPVVHRTLIAFGIGVFALTIVKRATGFGGAVLIVSGIAGAAGAFAAQRFAAIRLWMRYLAFAPIAFALLFMFASAVTPVAFDRNPNVETAAVGQPNRVVFIMLDELPLTTLLDGSGQIDSTLFPNFAVLADSSTWFRNTTTVSPLTETAVPAALSGMIPERERALPFVSEYPENLFTMLAGEYATHVHESVTRLCPVSLCRQSTTSTNLHPGFAGMLRDSWSLWWDAIGPTRHDGLRFDGLASYDVKSLRTAEQFVSRIRPSEKPRLDFLHVLLPHFPWHYLPTGQDYVAFPAHRNGFVDGIWENDAAAEAAKVRHILQAQATDRFIGTLLGRLREIGEYDDTLIVVTADHGAAFAGGLPFRGVAESTWPEVMWIPLFVKTPGQTQGTVDDRPARSIDIVPTVADLLEIELAWDFDGVSLFADATVAKDERPLLDVDASILRPPDGDRMLTFDGEDGFARVIERRGVPGDPADELRAFRAGAFGDLLGQPVELRADDELVATIDRLETYSRVDHFNPAFPWAVFHGTAEGIEVGTPVALVVNGQVAVTTEAQARTSGSGVEFWGIIPPQLLEFGANALELARIDGTVDDFEMIGMRVDAGPTR